MPSMNDVVAGAGALASDVQQLIDAWKGTAGKGIPASLTAINDPVNFALAVRNNDAGASKAFIAYKADGTVLFQVDKNGVIASADGTAGASQIPTLTGTQTLTNKTLTAPTITGTVAGGAIYTAPHFTAPVVDSGGLTITAGGLTITAGGLVLTAGSVVVPQPTGLAAWSLDGSAAGASIVNNTAFAPFGAANNFGGLLLIHNATNGEAALVLVASGNTFIVFQSGTTFSVTAAAAGRLSVYLNAGAVNYQNQLGSTQDIRTISLRNRSAA